MGEAGGSNADLVLGRNGVEGIAFGACGRGLPDPARAGGNNNISTGFDLDELGQSRGRPPALSIRR